MDTLTTNDPDTATEGGLHKATCCRLRSTPETSAAWHDCIAWLNQRDEREDPHHVALANLAEKLERERDEAIAEATNAVNDIIRVRYERDDARRALSELFDAMLRYEGDVDGEAPSKHHRMMNRCRAVLFPDNS